MTMNTHVAQSVRRTLVVLAMMTGAHGLIHDWLHADAEVPPAVVDRVRISFADGPPQEIVDGGVVSRITGIVRANADRGYRHRDTLCYFGHVMEFFRGDEQVGHVVWKGRTLVFSARDEAISVLLSEADAGELRWLTGAPAE